MAEQRIKRRAAGGPGKPSRLKVLPGGSPTPAPSFRLLTQVSAALSTSLDLDHTLREVLERLNGLVAFDAATLFLLDERRGQLEVKAAIGVPVALQEVRRFTIGEGVVGWVVQHASTALITDSTVDPRFQPTAPARAAKTVLAAPLRTQKHAFGALVLVRSAREPFTADHQRLVEAIANQAAVAIDHARLFDAERASRRRAEALLATAQACSEADSTPELLRRAVTDIASLMRAPAAAVILADRQGATVQASFESTDAPDPVLQEMVGRPFESLSLHGRLAQASEPVLLLDGESRAKALGGALWAGLPVGAVALVPLRWQERLLAGLLVGFAASDRVLERESTLLAEIAGQLALGIERLLLQERLKEQLEELAVAGERNRIARDLHDGILQYVYALGLALEHARDTEGQPEAVRAALSQAVEQVNHVLSELRTVIYQLRPAVMKEQEIGEWVVNLCRRFQQATGITVDATVSQAQNREVAPEVTIALLRLVQEALANTYQHSGAKSARLALDFSAADVRLRLEDEGRGFDTGERRVPRIEGGHGLGNMEERVRELGGTLSVESAPGRGVRLEAVIPR